MIDLILKKERTRINGELLSVGRDSPQWKMKMNFENYRWHVLEIETEEGEGSSFTVTVTEKISQRSTL